MNEAQGISRCLEQFITEKLNNKYEIIVVDGGSSDNTLNEANKFPVQVIQTKSSRAVQMNAGASQARGEWLYFIHADTFPPKDWWDDFESLKRSKNLAGTYRSKFIGGPKMLILNAFFTRFNWLVARGGDQSLFIENRMFQELNGFNEELYIMEEYPLLSNLMERGVLKVFQKKIRISTRKYDNRSWLKVSRANFIAFRMFKKRKPSREIKEKYIQLLG